jgi:hypothetical protein
MVSGKSQSSPEKSFNSAISMSSLSFQALITQHPALFCTFWFALFLLVIGWKRREVRTQHQTDQRKEQHFGPRPHSPRRPRRYLADPHLRHDFYSNGSFYYLRSTEVRIVPETGGDSSNKNIPSKQGNPNEATHKQDEKRRDRKKE